MSSFDLISVVQPSEGWFAVVGIADDKPVHQKLVATREEADRIIEKYADEGRNVFFGVAKYKSDAKRSKDNVLALKALWVDIDCGPKKGEPNPTTGIPDGYPDQSSALAALKAFCDFVGLPLPILVNSGRGIHAYWVLKEAVSREAWEVVARRLAQVCRTQKFYVDPAVFEPARILRVPGTYNYKDDPPLPVTVIRDKVESIALEEVADLIGVDLEEESGKLHKVEKAKVAKTELDRRREESPLFQQQKAAEMKSFAHLMRRSLNDNGCNQMKLAYVNRSSLSYRQWWHGLSIALHCDDKDDAVQKLSQGHPDYNPQAVNKIVASTSEPHRCETIEADTPGGCDGCPFRGRVGSPITLAKLIRTEEPATVPPPEEPEQPERAERPEEPDDVEEELGAVGGVDIAPPVGSSFFLPSGYQRRVGGGIVTLNKDGVPELVYEHDLHVVKRMVDVALGEIAIIRLALPKDKVRIFNVPNAELSDIAKARTKLAFYGIACGGRVRFERIFNYLFAAYNEIQFIKEAEEMRLQLGWADNDTKFIVGDKEITVDGTYHSPPSSATRDVVAAMHEKGSLEEWKKVVDLYGRPTMEAAAFGVLTALGSPLFKFTGHSGALINLIHPFSGSGKTTVLRVVNSFYGHPKELLNVSDDTYVSRIHKLGVYNNLPPTFDEITNMKGPEFSGFTYATSTGKGRDRMKASGNELRNNSTRWQCMALCSSNASFYEKLAAEKANPDGERMRLFEYKLEMTGAIDLELGRRMFDQVLFENYGLAGPIYLEWLVRNKELAIHTLKNVQATIDSDCKTTQRERFWSSIIACNITGGILARKYLKLISWDLKAIYAWSKSTLAEMRDIVEPPKFNVANIIGDYYDRYAQNVLIIDGNTDARTKLTPLPVKEPRGPLMIRYEPDTKRMILSVAAFRKECRDSQTNYNDIVKEMERCGAATRKNYYLSKGLGGPSVLSYSLVLDMTNPFFKGVITDPAIAPTADGN